MLPLHDFQITRLQELDYALYLLNFDRIEVAWLTGNAWRVHYRMPCGNLELPSRRCRVHGTPEQPAVCKSYDAYTCFYKRIFQSPEAPTPSYVRFDARRLRALADMMVFDGNREIVGMPDVSAAAAMLPPMAPVFEDGPPPPPTPMLDAWEAAARTGSGLAAPQIRTFQDFDQPCAGCDAYCCTRLSFPHSTPANVSNLDHLRFLLGFPGIEIGVTDGDQWTVIVRTRCAHLTPDSQCGLFGQALRPRVCSLYDAKLCAYKYQHGQPRPPQFLRLRRAQFEHAAALFRFDDNGYAVQRPSYAEIRQRIEAHWAHA